MRCVAFFSPPSFFCNNQPLPSLLHMPLPPSFFSDICFWMENLKRWLRSCLVTMAPKSCLIVGYIFVYFFYPSWLHLMCLRTSSVSRLLYKHQHLHIFFAVELNVNFCVKMFSLIWCVAPRNIPFHFSRYSSLTQKQNPLEIEAFFYFLSKRNPLPYPPFPTARLQQVNLAA